MAVEGVDGVGGGQAKNIHHVKANWGLVLPGVECVLKCLRRSR